MNFLILPAAYVCLSAFLLWELIGAHGKWGVKVMCMALTLYVGFVLWKGTEDIFGHPKQSTLESVDGRSGYLFWARVEEPTKIALWVRLDGDNEPKVYAFPYTREFHKLAEHFIEKIMANGGEPIRIQFADEDKEQKGKGGHGQGRRGAQGPAAADGTIDGARMPYIQPSPTPAPK